MTADTHAVPDAELMLAVQRGDTAAFAVLYDRHAGTVFGAAYRRLGDRRLTDEVVQDVWLACWDRAELFDPTAGTLPGWLTTIARNRAVDRLRALGRRPGALPLSALFVTDSDGAADPSPGEVLMAGGAATDPALIVDEHALRDLMLEALAQLPPDERQPLELAYYGELSQSEIADRLGIPIGTVKTRTRRALARLRTRFAQAGLTASWDAREAPVETPADDPGVTRGTDGAALVDGHDRAGLPLAIEEVTDGPR